MTTRLTPAVEAALTEAGYRPGQVLGAGMEGVVVDLGDDLVAKTWHTRGAADLERLRLFYQVVADSGLTLDTPRIVRVLPVGGQHATVERRLRGRPLRDQAGDRHAASDSDVRCVVDVLDALRLATPDAAMSSLPVLEGEPAFDSAVPFGTSLAALVDRRTRRSQDVLAPRVPDLDRVLEAVTARLRATATVEPALVHGDLIPANILVDEVGLASGVLDFGFLTTLGDPRFDAAVAASIFDMYGEHGRASEAVLDAAVAEHFGYQRPVLHLYRAAYALATSTCFSASGSDGHFAWCTAMLNRVEVRESLGW